MRLLALAVALCAVPVLAAPLNHGHSGGFPSAQDVATLLAQINTTLSSGDPALDAARQAVVHGLFDARTALQALLALNDKQAHDAAQRALDDLKIAQGGVDNIEAAIERNSTANPAECVRLPVLAC